MIQKSVELDKLSDKISLSDQSDEEHDANVEDSNDKRNNLYSIGSLRMENSLKI